MIRDGNLPYSYSRDAVQVLPSAFKGVTYRSRTEARWAVFFDALGVAAEWEPEGFELDGLRYLPDFWVPAWGVFVEVKPDLPSMLQWEKAQRLATVTGKALLFVFGPPGRDDGLMVFPDRQITDEHRAPVARIRRCRHCRSMCAWLTWVDGTGAHPLGECGRPDACGEKDHTESIDDEMQRAIEIARGYRFDSQTTDQGAAE